MTNDEVGTDHGTVLEGENLTVRGDEEGNLSFIVRHSLTQNHWYELPQDGNGAQDASLYRLAIVDLLFMSFQLEAILDPASDVMEEDDRGEIAYADDAFRIYFTSTEEYDSYSFFRNDAESLHPIGNDCMHLYALAGSVGENIEHFLEEVGRQVDVEFVDLSTPIWPELTEIDSNSTECRFYFAIDKPLQGT
ncbi:MAG: hypothetical protein NVSMB52_04460 [Chloroflexota bacterium]